MNCNYKVKITDIQTKYKFKVFCTGYDDSELKQKIDTMYEAWPKASGEGETPTLDNTANATMFLDLKGNTSQVTTTGKNLCANNLLPITHDGITISKNNNGDIVVNGTPTYTSGYRTFDIGDVITYEAGTYTSSVVNKRDGIGINFGDGAINLTMSDTVKVKTNVFSSDLVVNPQINIRYDAGTFNNYIFNPMLEKSSTATTYEPYTNGASPNPDYPQDVEVVTGDNTIKIEGNNLLNLTNGTYSANGVTAVVSNGIVTLNGTATANSFITIPVNTNYSINVGEQFTVSLNNASINNACSLRVNSGGQYDVSGTAINNYRASTLDASLPLFSSSITIRTGSGGSYTNYVIKPQLSKGTTVTTYEPYQSQSYAVNLGTMELCKIGNYQDYIYKDNKKWYKYGAIGKVVLNGSENWTKSSNTNVNRYYIPGTFINTILNVNTIDLISDYFTCITPTQSDAYNVGLSKLNNTSIMANFSLSDTSFDTSQKFTTWLSTHNVVVYYVLATPTTTEITDATLISQLEALANAESYSGQTNISQTNDDKPFIITAKALKDLSNL